MKSIKSVAVPAAVIVFVLCVYAFLLGNEVFDGKFKNEAIAWYILAKGIFCSVALVALSGFSTASLRSWVVRHYCIAACVCSDGRTRRKI
jgi:hypothetical protein